MNILFIGNCIVWQSIKFIPYILNSIKNIEEHNINIKFCYTAAGKIDNYLKNFNTRLNNVIVRCPAKYPNVLYSYVKGENKYNMERMPDISIKEIILKEKWDKIIISPIHSIDKCVYMFNELEEKLRKFKNMIREIYDGELYLMFPSLITRESHPKCEANEIMLKNKNELYFLGRNNLEIIYELLFNKICESLELIGIKTQEAYSKIWKSKLNNMWCLMRDGRHYDEYIGCYLLNCVIYYSLLYEMLGVKLNSLDIKFPYKKRNYLRCFTGDEIEDFYDVEITKENKKIVDDIIEKFFNIS